MNVSYQHANPDSGNESTLLRFRDGLGEQAACVLVDAGRGVDLDALLEEDEYLTAVLLTHAHLDHYRSLPEVVRDGAPVYASRPTADVLETVLRENAKRHDLGGVEDALSAVSPLSGWESITGEVDVRPVPAGHAPGASGFLLRFSDGSETRHVLATGDFAPRRAAGYPGFPADLPVGVDALFVNVATNERFEETLTASLETVWERAQAGSSVLVTAGGLTGVRYAYLLSHLADRFERRVPITLVGQAAKLYADLGYDLDCVDPVPVFDAPSELLAPGSVTIAGPEVPTDGSAGRLFAAIEDDSAATLVQLGNGGVDPIESAGCTVHSYELIDHPSVETVDAVVERLRPTHVVVKHGGRRTTAEYRGKYDDSFVWANDDAAEYGLYDGGQCCPPPWLSERAVRAIRSREWIDAGGRLGSYLDDEDVPLPSVGREADASLEDEGVLVGELERRFAPAQETGPPRRSEVPRASEGASGSRTDDAENAAPRGGDEEPTRPPEFGGRSSLPPADADFRETVLARLDAIEAAVSGATVSARVADAGDGTLLLKLLGDAPVEHGQEIEVRLLAGGESGDGSAPEASVGSERVDGEGAGGERGDEKNGGGRVDGDD